MNHENVKNFVLSRLTLLGTSVTDLAAEYDCAVEQIYKVLAGHVSGGLRGHIARACGYKDWPTLTLEAGKEHKAAKDKVRRLNNAILTVK